MEYGPLNRMTETTEGLKSGVAPAGGHFCGVQVSARRPIAGLLAFEELSRFRQAGHNPVVSALRYRLIGPNDLARARARCHELGRHVRALHGDGLAYADAQGRSGRALTRAGPFIQSARLLRVVRGGGVALHRRRRLLAATRRGRGCAASTGRSFRCRASSARALVERRAARAALAFLIFLVDEPGGELAAGSVHFAWMALAAAAPHASRRPNPTQDHHVQD
jgi:hypothetical protein